MKEKNECYPTVPKKKRSMINRQLKFHTKQPAHKKKTRIKNDPN